MNPGRRSPANASQRGQLLVIFGISIIAIILLVGLVIDGGVAFASRRDAQNTADLASLAGTKIVADNYTKGGRTGAEVFKAVDDTVKANGCQSDNGSQCTWSAQYVNNLVSPIGAVTNGGSIPGGAIGSAAQGVQVTISQHPRTYFISVAGQSTWSVGAGATSLTYSSTPESVQGQLLPIGVNPPNTSFTSGQIIDVTAGMNGPGNFGWLEWPPANSNAVPVLETALCQPNNPALTFPTWIYGDPGSKNSNGVRDCLDYWIRTGATVLLPIWDITNGEGGNNLQYRVTGLVAVQLLTHDQPAVDHITARVVGYYEGTSIGANYGGPPCDPDLPSCTEKSEPVQLIR